MKLAALFTGGKDSTYAIYLAKKQKHEITCLITLKSKNPYSYMFHTPTIELTKLQAEAMQLPLITQTTEGKKETELKDLENTIKKAKQKYNFEALLTGALFSQYQKSRIEKIAKKLNLKALSLLWHNDQEELIWDLLKNKFEIIIVSIAAEGFDESWLGRKIDEKTIEDLIKLNKKNKINVAAEGGEYESLVLNCPLFKKKIKIIKAKKIMDSSCSGRLLIEKAKLF